MKTRVVFNIAEPTEFLSRENYDSLGITLLFDKGKLKALQLVIEPDEGATYEEIVRQARDRIVPLLALIRFGQGVPLQLGVVNTKIVDPESAVEIGLASHKGDTVISRPIPLPPTKMVANLPNGVVRQLGWYNSAGDSGWVIERIRNYFEVLELESELGSYKPPAELKWLRDAVSHPQPRNQAVTNYLHEHLGTDHIDPNDDSHLRFLEGKTELFRREAEGILLRKLPRWWQ